MNIDVCGDGRAEERFQEALNTLREVQSRTQPLILHALQRIGEIRPEHRNASFAYIILRALPRPQHTAAAATANVEAAVTAEVGLEGLVTHHGQRHEPGLRQHDATCDTRHTWSGPWGEAHGMECNGV